MNKGFNYLDIEKILKCKKESSDYYSAFLEEILKGVPDIIGVYKPDNTIMFYNNAGYAFYGKTFEEVKGKKCYEMLNRTEKCKNCTVARAIKHKKIIHEEKYIPELNKYMECCCTPVLDTSDKIVLVVEQLRDVTEKKYLYDLLKESEERYRKIVNLSPDAIFIIVDNMIVFANKASSRLIGLDNSNIIGKNIYKFSPNFEKIASKRINQILEEKITKSIYDYNIVHSDGRMLDVEVSSSYILYKGKQAILSVARDISELKKGLNKAAKIQKNALQKEFILPSKAELQPIYVPAKTVSGDFYHMVKINDEFVIGIVADVCGKGITAALNISAFNVLFHEAVLISNDPREILNNLNKKVVYYLDENYIAACCFSLDFKNKTAKIVGAGINEFIFQSYNNQIEKKVVRGPFLGMFEDSKFDEKIINFNSKDKFFFFTDGLEFIFEDNTSDIYFSFGEIKELRKCLYKTLNNMLLDAEGLKDDCTLLAIEIH